MDIAARGYAKELRRKIDRGEDPLGVKQLRRGDPTFGDLVELRDETGLIVTGAIILGARLESVPTDRQHLPGQVLKRAAARDRRTKTKHSN